MQTLAGDVVTAVLNERVQQASLTPNKLETRTIGKAPDLARLREGAPDHWLELSLDEVPKPHASPEAPAMSLLLPEVSRT